jgi:hypothetical protein
MTLKCTGGSNGFDKSGLILRDKKFFVENAITVQRHPELNCKFVKIGEKLIFLDEEKGPYLMPGVNANKVNSVPDSAYFVSEGQVYYFNSLLTGANADTFKRVGWIATDNQSFFTRVAKLPIQKT